MRHFCISQHTAGVTFTSTVDSNNILCEVGGWVEPKKTAETSFELSEHKKLVSEVFTHSHTSDLAQASVGSCRVLTSLSYRSTRAWGSQHVA